MSEKNIAFDVTEVDLKNKPDWFLKISPYGKVPVLQHEDHVLYESSIINEYLDEVFPQVPMMPGSPAERASMRIWIDFCNTRVQPHVSNMLKALPEEFDGKVKAFEESLQALEQHLERTGMPGPYFGGAHFTLVDATYAPSFERFGVLPRMRGYQVPARFERVLRWAAALAAHPSVKAHTMPQDVLVENYRSFLPEHLRAQVA